MWKLAEIVPSTLDPISVATSSAAAAATHPSVYASKSPAICISARRLRRHLPINSDRRQQAVSICDVHRLHATLVSIVGTPSTTPAICIKHPTAPDPGCCGRNNSIIVVSTSPIFDNTSNDVRLHHPRRRQHASAEAVIATAPRLPRPSASAVRICLPVPVRPRRTQHPVATLVPPDQCLHRRVHHRMHLFLTRPIVRQQFVSVQGSNDTSYAFPSSSAPLSRRSQPSTVINRESDRHCTRPNLASVSHRCPLLARNPPASSNGSSLSYHRPPFPSVLASARHFHLVDIRIVVVDMRRHQHQRSVGCNRSEETPRQPAGVEEDDNDVEKSS
ncbi:hypothetical protein ACLOJK_000655 [Asimina triloba]